MHINGHRFATAAAAVQVAERRLPMPMVSPRRARAHAKLFFNMQSRAIITGTGGGSGGSCQSKDRQAAAAVVQHRLFGTLGLLSPFCPSFNQTHMAFECGGALQAAAVAAADLQARLFSVDICAH